jgi:hypothetical protein
MHPDRHPHAAARLLSLLVLAAAALGVAGCGSSQLMNMWRNPDLPATPMDHLFVIAVKNDPARRRIMEDAFVKALSSHGVEATPSYRVFPDALPDSAQVRDSVRAGGYDGVLVASRLPSQTSSVYVPGYTTIEPRTRYNTWRNAYYTYYVDVVHPGYVEEQKLVRHRVDVWSVGDNGQLVWSAVGQSIDPQSLSQVSQEISGRIVPELVKTGVIRK